MKKFLSFVLILFVGAFFWSPDKEAKVAPREISLFEYSDFMNFTELRAVVNTSAGQYPGDRLKQIERVEKWASGKQTRALRSLLEQMDFVPVCVPEKQGILNALAEKQNENDSRRF